MGAILWEDTIQRELLAQGRYTGQQAARARPRYAANAPPGDRVHLQRATRRSPYFAHTRTGKKYADRPFISVVADESWSGEMDDDAL